MPIIPRNKDVDVDVDAESGLGPVPAGVVVELQPLLAFAIAFVFAWLLLPAVESGGRRIISRANPKSKSLREDPRNPMFSGLRSR